LVSALVSGGPFAALDGGIEEIVTLLEPEV